MNISRSWLLGALVALSGCVHGSGCLFLQPIKHTLTGRTRFLMNVTMLLPLKPAP